MKQLQLKCDLWICLVQLWCLLERLHQAVSLGCWQGVSPEYTEHKSSPVHLRVLRDSTFTYIYHKLIKSTKETWRGRLVQVEKRCRNSPGNPWSPIIRLRWCLNRMLSMQSTSRKKWNKFHRHRPTNSKHRRPELFAKGAFSSWSLGLRSSSQPCRSNCQLK